MEDYKIFQQGELFDVTKYTPKVVKADKGCLMAEFDNLGMRDILNFSSSTLRASELHELGVEKDPHITVVYGFPLNFDYNCLTSYLSDISFPIQLTCNEVESFPNETDGFDAVVFKMNPNPLLNRLHYRLIDDFRIETKYPDYKIHATLGYVKIGEGAKYKQKWKLPVKYILKGFIYSMGSDKPKYEWDNKDKKFYRI